MSRRVWVLLAVLVVAVVGVVGVARVLSPSSKAESAPTTSPSAAQTTSGTASASASGKTRAVPSTAAHTTVHTPDPMSGQTLVTEQPVVVTARVAPVTITFFGWDQAKQVAQAGGYVTGVIESGGTCTLTLSKGGQTATGTTTAHADATTTTCGAVTIPGSQLTAGTWQAVLSYRSDRHTGKADPVAIEVIR